MFSCFKEYVSSLTGIFHISNLLLEGLTRRLHLLILADLRVLNYTVRLTPTSTLGLHFCKVFPAVQLFAFAPCVCEMLFLSAIAFKTKI